MKQYKTEWERGSAGVSGGASHLLKEEVSYFSEVNGVCTAAPSEGLATVKQMLVMNTNRGKQPVKRLGALQRSRASRNRSSLMYYVPNVYAHGASVLSSAPCTGTSIPWISARSTPTGRKCGCRAASPARPAARSPSQLSPCWRGRPWSLHFSRRGAGKWDNYTILWPYFNVTLWSFSILKLKFLSQWQARMSPLPLTAYPAGLI